MAGATLKRKASGGELCDRAAAAPKRRRGKCSKKGGHPLQAADAVNHPVLAQCYPRLQTLRQYVLSKLPPTSKIRRRKIAAVSLGTDAAGGDGVAGIEAALSRLLDTTVVGLSRDRDEEGEASWHALWEQWLSCSQKGDESYVTLREGAGRSQSWSQAEIVDSVIWCLFERAKSGRKAVAKYGEVRPSHLLCDGFRCESRRQSKPMSSVPGLFTAFPNQRAQILKTTPWPELLLLLGSAGERIMRNLLLDVSLFVPLGEERNNYWQLSGVSLAALDAVSQKTLAGAKTMGGSDSPATRAHPPSDIIFVRSRILYARAALNAKGSVRFGLRHVHVLNRFPYRNAPKGGAPGQDGDVAEQQRRLVRVMMYMFPRQFGLHNVFTSKVDKTKTTQKFQDYTVREEEILAKCGGPDDKRWLKPRLPKRLRGEAKELVQKLRILHSRCSYAQLLHHYCPVQAAPDSSEAGSGGSNDKQRSGGSPESGRATKINSLTELATPLAKVSAFCRAVLRNIIPRGFWGTRTGEENLAVFLKVIDRFVRLRRFESMSLHSALQDLKISTIEWLSPPHLKGQKPGQSETRKRQELFHEFLYYLVDSVLIPLIRSNFYVTESSVHRYRLFYFRHDVWRHVAEPAMAALRTRMFEEVRLEDARAMLEGRALGFSQVRLLPKNTGMRPIMNLRRRTLKQGGRMVLGSSINALLAPLQSVLDFERTTRPAKLGSALFSVGDIYARVRDFRTHLLGRAAAAAGAAAAGAAAAGAAAARRGNKTLPKLYFAKVDVQAAFDTIPQDAVLALVDKIPTRSCYSIVKYLALQCAPTAQSAGKVGRKWTSLAKPASDRTATRDLLARRVAASKTNSVFVDSAMQQERGRDALLELLGTHIGQNLVRMGKKYYRQKEGIPQGSVLSSLLCNYFYADLEARTLPFLRSDDCLLLRLIDDFLLVTTDRAKAARFVRVMHDGVPEYGVVVSAGKSLVNFPVWHNGHAVPQLSGGDDDDDDNGISGGRSSSSSSQGFPYCGILLDCTTLAMSRDHRRSTALPKENANKTVFNALTVETARRPGAAFQRKVLHSFRTQAAHLLFDTAHNGPDAVLRNLHAALRETAAKAWAYARCMAAPPADRVVVEAVRQLAGYAFALLAGRARRRRWPGYACAVRRAQVRWLACHAFRAVLGRKQGRYAGVLAWLDEEIRALAGLREVTCGPIARVVLD